MPLNWILFSWVISLSFDGVGMNQYRHLLRLGIGEGLHESFDVMSIDRADIFEIQTLQTGEGGPAKNPCVKSSTLSRTL